MLPSDANTLIYARVMCASPDHFANFERLCREVNATGKLVAIAQHAAVAVEHGCTMVSTHSDFNRFPSLRCQHPLRRVERQLRFTE